MDKILESQVTYVNTNIFLEDTIEDFKLKFTNLTDEELNCLFWLWEIKFNEDRKRDYINKMTTKLGKDTMGNILAVDKLTLFVFNKHELIYREIRNRWLSKFVV
jgi:hypothetical protein